MQVGRTESKPGPGLVNHQITALLIRNQMQPDTLFTILKIVYSNYYILDVGIIFS